MGLRTVPKGLTGLHFSRSDWSCDLVTSRDISQTWKVCMLMEVKTESAILGPYGDHSEVHKGCAQPSEASSESLEATGA